MLFAIALACAAIVFIRVACIASRLDRDSFLHVWQFHAIAFSYTALLTGAVGVVASKFAPLSTVVLLIGVAGLIVFSRRTI